MKKNNKPGRKEAGQCPPNEAQDPGTPSDKAERDKDRLLQKLPIQAS